MPTTTTTTTTKTTSPLGEQHSFHMEKMYGDQSVMLLYGGGIDSTALLHWLSTNSKKVGAVFFDYGQKANECEREACEYFCKKYGAELFVLPLSLQFLAKSAILKGSDSKADNPKANVLDGRNLMLLATAGVLAVERDYNRLAVGFHLEPASRPFPDASPEFLDSVNSTLQQAFIADLEVIAPFKNQTREDIFDYAEFADSEILLKAHTCYEGVKGGCGTCSHCWVKAELMANNKVNGMSNGIRI